MIVSTLTTLAEALGVIVLTMTGLLAVWHLTQPVIALTAILARKPIAGSSETWRELSKAAPRVSILVPAYNEQTTIVTSVRSLLAVAYPDFEIIVINDGSSDKTVAVVLDAFGMQAAPVPEKGMLDHQPVTAAWTSVDHPNLLVIDKRNGGKADALNAGANAALGDYVCVIDADSVLDRDALLRAVRHCIDKPGKVAALAGAIRLSNGCTMDGSDVVSVNLPRNPLALFQVVEYLRVFDLVRPAMSALGATILISGAFGLFSRDLLYRVGGYLQNTVGEDFELGVRMQRYIWEKGLDLEFIYEPDAVCWTQAPERLKDLSSQRARWQRGALETLWHHKDLVASPRHGRLSGVAITEAVLADIVTPLTEVLGFIVLPLLAIFGLLSPIWFISYFLLAASIGVINCAAALILEELRFQRFRRGSDLAMLLGAAALECFGYRQLCGWWRARGVWQWLRRDHSWGKIARQSIKQVRGAAPSR
jgi:cellulose synthase/poly-beta-1,6-N-acetylglucosamine synthase-like glycosyltransferase